jgi:hypothetical protein
LWCSQSGDHPENNAAKFGFLLDMKVVKNKIFLCSWLPNGTYNKNLKFFFEIWQIFHEEPFE